MFPSYPDHFTLPSLQGWNRLLPDDYFVGRQKRMNFDRYYVVLLKKGPTWTPEATPELEALQERHLAHLGQLHAAGQLRIAGPVEDHNKTADIRGISIFPATAVASIDEVKSLVEDDPMFAIGRLVADYLTWYVPAGASLAEENK
jgi:uncharacterized protein YciI